MFRAALISSTAELGPPDGTLSRAAYVYTTYAAAARVAYATNDTDIHAATADAVVSATADAAAISPAAFTASWKAVESDACTLTIGEASDPVISLLRTPLWPQAKTPAWARKCWTALCGDSALRKAGFAPWFDWYEGLLPLSGTTPSDRFGPPLTRRIALQPQGWWDRGAKAVNADIAAWLAEQDAETAVPPQVPAAYRFTEQGGRIGLAPQDVTATNLAAAQAFLDELRERAVQAAERLENARNAVPFLEAEVSRLRDFLPAAAADLNPFLLRCRLVSIDAAVVTLQTAGASRELADDPTMQVTGLALIGRELMLSFPDQRNREREEIARAIPPGQERQIAKALAEVSKVAAQAPEVVTEQAAAALVTMSTMTCEAADGPADAQRERIVEQVVVNRNFLSEVVRFGWDIWDRVQRGALDGAEVVLKHAPIFGFAGLVSALTDPVFGVPAFGFVALFAGYDQIERGLKLLERLIPEHAKELKKPAKKLKADG